MAKVIWVSKEKPTLYERNYLTCTLGAKDIIQVEPPDEKDERVIIVLDNPRIKLTAYVREFVPIGKAEDIERIRRFVIEVLGRDLSACHGDGEFIRCFVSYTPYKQCH